jgi:hypothetical protein
VKSKDQIPALLIGLVVAYLLFPPVFLLTLLTDLYTVLVTACALSLFHGEAPCGEGVHDAAEHNISMGSDAAVIFQKNSRKNTFF